MFLILHCCAKQLTIYLSFKKEGVKDIKERLNENTKAYQKLKDICDEEVEILRKILNCFRSKGFSF